MTKSRKNSSSKYSLRKYRKTNLFKNFKKTSTKAVPIVESGLKTVGTTVKKVAVKSAPTVNKGLEGIYGVLATGFDMGIKGVSKVSKMTKKNHSNHHNKSNKKGGTTRRY